MVVTGWERDMCRLPTTRGVAERRLFKQNSIDKCKRRAVHQPAEEFISDRFNCDPLLPPIRSASARGAGGARNTERLSRRCFTGCAAADCRRGPVHTTAPHSYSYHELYFEYFCCQIYSSRYYTEHELGTSTSAFDLRTNRL